MRNETLQPPFVDFNRNLEQAVEPSLCVPGEKYVWLHTLRFVIERTPEIGFPELETVGNKRNDIKMAYPKRRTMAPKTLTLIKQNDRSGFPCCSAAVGSFSIFDIWC